MFRKTTRNWLYTLIVMGVAFFAPVAFASGPITHFVSVGGPDILGPGGDKSIAMSAKEKDGVVTGKLTDGFSNENGGGGYHADINCLSVSGNEAWVRGVIRSGTSYGNDITGLNVYLRVRDNGTSANDPPDEVSYSIITSVFVTCESHPNLAVYEMPQGQVIVR